MGQAQIVMEECFAVPPERLFEVIADHEGMSRWMKTPVSVIAGSGDGVGTVRRINARGLKIDEEVTYLDPPRRMVYRLIRGLPGLRFHRGEILVTPWGKSGSQLRWDILIDTWVPGTAALIAKALEPEIRRGLARLRTQLAGEAAAA